MDQESGQDSEQFVPNPVIEQVASDAAETVLQTENKTTPVDKRRHFLAAFFLSFMFGVFGVDRFYLGKHGTGILKLLTLGGFGFWAMIDLSMIVSGSMRDQQGRDLIDAAKYHRFARNFLLIFSAVMILLLALLVGVVFFAISQFIQSGGVDGLLQSMPGMGGLDLNSGASKVDTNQVFDQLKSMYNGI